MNRKIHTPKHCLHKPSGRGYVRLNGKCFYTGDWGSDEAERTYAELLATWLASNRTSVVSYGQADYKVQDLVADYLCFGDEYYRKNGVPTKEIVNIRYAAKPLLKLFGLIQATEFGPKRLKVYREELIRQDLCRNLINQRVGIIKRMFTWGASEEKISGETAAALRSVAGLKYGRSGARESAPVKAVSETHYEAALAELDGPIAAMVQIQWLTGMRPGEAVQMRWADIEAEGKVWMYRPRTHKTEHHGRDRVIPLGPKVKAILRGFRKLDAKVAIFSPADEDNTGGTVSYSTVTYRRAVTRACDRAGIPRWTPNQLRHSAATRVRREYGLDAARALLGHASSAVTEVYAEVDAAKSMQIMGEVG
jgi:integrase